MRWRRRRPSRSRRRPQRPRRRPQRRQRPSRVSDCVCRKRAAKQHLLSSVVLRDHHSGHAATSNFKGNAIRRRWFRRIHNLGNVSDSHFSFERDRVVCLCQSCDVREIIRASRRSHGSVQLPRPRANRHRISCIGAERCFFVFWHLGAGLDSALSGAPGGAHTQLSGQGLRGNPTLTWRQNAHHGGFLWLHINHAFLWLCINHAFLWLYIN